MSASKKQASKSVHGEHDDDNVLSVISVIKEPQKRAQNLSEKDIDDAYFQLLIKDANPSARAVRAVLGKGSMTTIQKRVSELERKRKNAELDDIIKEVKYSEYVDDLYKLISSTVAAFRLKIADEKVEAIQRKLLSEIEIHQKRELEMGETFDSLNDRIAELSNSLAHKDMIIKDQEAQKLELAHKFNDCMQQLSFERGKRQVAEDLLLKFKERCPAIKAKNAEYVGKIKRKDDNNS